MVFTKTLTALALALPAQAVIPDIAGFTLTWGDDFTGAAGAQPDPTNWVFTTGTSYPGGAPNFGTGEIQTYTNAVDNVQLSGTDTLKITALKDATGAWTSARLETNRTDFAAPVGGKMRIQASISLPDVGTAGVGYWPAFWALGSTFRGNYQNWPVAGELDIMENVNAVNEVWGTMHCDVSPGGACHEQDGLSGNLTCAGTPCQGNFHKYTLEVDRTAAPEAVRWFLDDTLFWQLTDADVPAAVWTETIGTSYFVLLNIAIGGSFPDKNFGSPTPLADTVSGGTMEVEYVAVYNA
ncbi:Beta-glucanase 3 [Colletotrichum chlorophyti]|uniref:Beta-glucanase 3 n=1 Tax=Colletotrichum chlorophyti TaxID=708187 RepID=A0A1Q8RQE7_9PEZI|nr:Beta-glucanase 3 [Colletotrichum chlorophyti]